LLTDECSPPPNLAELKSSLNVNGSVCLNLVCYYDNVTVGEPCVLENLVFVGWSVDGDEFPDIRSRDKCVLALSIRFVSLDRSLITLAPL